MKISTALLATTTSSLVLAAAGQFNIVADAPNNDAINNKPIAALHEGAGINFAFVGSGYDSNPPKFQLNTTVLAHMVDGAQFPSAVQIWEEANNVMEIGVIGASQGFSVKDEYLALNGTTDNWYACTKMPQLGGYQYSGSIIAYYSGAAPAEFDCESVKLKTRPVITIL